MKETIRKTTKLAGSFILPLVLLTGSVALTGCNNDAVPAAIQQSKINLDNYNKIVVGMNKAQVDTILGPESSADTKDMVIFKKTTYKYVDGQKYISLTFKNDELETKDSNLQAAAQ